MCDDEHVRRGGKTHSDHLGGSEKKVNVLKHSLCQKFMKLKVSVAFW